MRRKYFFFDIDGTLTSNPQGGNIPASTKAAIRELRKKGHFLAIATGRAYAMAEAYLDEFDFDNMVSDGGNAVTINRVLQGIEPLDKDCALALIDECEAKGIPWGVSYENARYRWCKNTDFLERTKDSYMETKINPDLNVHELSEIYKVYVCCDEAGEAAILGLKDVPYARYHPDYVFVEPDDKAKGIYTIMDYFHAPYEDVVVFGDGKNDLKMFREEWTSIAMGNAIPELKAKAAFVTKSVNDGGIAYACRHFGWIDGDENEDA